MQNSQIEKLKNRLTILEAESAIRKVQARYMFLCDTPNPELGCDNDQARIDLIMALFTDDAVWEGVGDYYDSQFGRLKGQKAIRGHFERFWDADTEPKLILNCHYLTSEQIRVHQDGTTGEGNWVHMQPWLFSNGKALLRSSRLFNSFRKCDDGVWRFTRNRTENVFVSPLTADWTSDFAKKSVLMQRD